MIVAVVGCCAGICFLQSRLRPGSPGHRASLVCCLAREPRLVVEQCPPADRRRAPFWSIGYLADFQWFALFDAPSPLADDGVMPVVELGGMLDPWLCEPVTSRLFTVC